MKILLTFAELAELPIGTKVARIQDGQIQTFWIGSYIENLKVLCLISGNSVTNAISIHKSTSMCGKNLTWFEGYDSQKVGEIMIAQLEYLIQSIKETYLKSI